MLELSVRESVFAIEGGEKLQRMLFVLDTLSYCAGIQCYDACVCWTFLRFGIREFVFAIEEEAELQILLYVCVKVGHGPVLYCTSVFFVLDYW